MLGSPNPDDPLANDVANMWKTNEDEAILKAKEWTRRYAVMDEWSSVASSGKNQTQTKSSGKIYLWYFPLSRSVGIILKQRHWIIPLFPNFYYL